jgi:hypothetical protein
VPSCLPKRTNHRNPYLKYYLCLFFSF